MSFADELRGNYNPPEERYYFKEIKYIIRTIKECAELESINGHSISGYYSYGGYEEGEGIYNNLNERANAWYLHLEDFGSYKERILSYGRLKDEQIITVTNVERALKEIKETLIREGFKNVIVEEKKIGERDVAYNTREMTFLERNKANRRSSSFRYKKGEKTSDHVKMPIYNLYISIEW